MRVYILSLFLLLGTLCSLHAQEGIKIGLRLSPISSFANITDEEGNQFLGLNRSSRPGFSYGLTANYGFTDNYGLYTGIHIVNKRFERNQDINLTNETVNASQVVRVSSIEIPAAIKLRSNEITTGLYIVGIFGLAFEFNTGYKNEFTGLNPINPTGDASGVNRNSDNIRRLTTSFIFGPAVDYETDFGMFNLGIIYHQMLSNINKLDSYGNSETIKIHYLAFDLGYFF
ncbi:MAG: outer membrane beta-barrel protein [Bacteroidota bacterium]